MVLFDVPVTFFCVLLYTDCASISRWPGLCQDIAWQMAVCICRIGTNRVQMNTCKQVHLCNLCAIGLRFFYPSESSGRSSWLLLEFANFLGLAHCLVPGPNQKPNGYFDPTMPSMIIHDHSCQLPSAPFFQCSTSSSENTMQTTC